VRAFTPTNTHKHDDQVDVLNDAIADLLNQPQTLDAAALAFLE